MTGNKLAARLPTLSALVLLAALEAGCATTPPPAELMQPGPEAAARRASQTRAFRDVSEKQLLVAAVGVLQDQGFRITASEARLGVVIGTKPRPLGEILADVGRKSLLAGFTLGLHPEALATPPDEFGVVVTTRSAGSEQDAYLVRATFWARGHAAPAGKRVLGWAEVLPAPALYQEFFQSLDQTLLREKRD